MTSEYSGKGLTGLVNLGNTCYINSAVQVISNMHILNKKIHEFIENKQEVKNRGSSFLKEWDDLRIMIWDKNVVISPNRFKRAIEIISNYKKNDLFAGFEQNDAIEFFMFLINIFHDTLKSRTITGVPLEVAKMRKSYKTFDTFFNKCHEEYSQIDALFTVYCKIEYIEKGTNNVLATQYENMYSIDVALTKLSLNECLDDFFKEEELSKENDNQYYDDKDKTYKDVVKRTYLFHTSKYLVIQLKRWNYNFKKNQRIIHHDPSSMLDLDRLYEDSKSMPKYELFAIINHSGNVGGGHYTSCVKNGNEKWYNYNDTMIKEIPMNKIVGNKNYCLVYRLK